jgi:hypothetical protein
LPNSEENKIQTTYSYNKVSITRDVYTWNSVTKAYDEKIPTSEFDLPIREKTVDLLSGPISVTESNDKFIITPDILKNAEYTYEPMDGGTGMAPPENHKEKFINGICNSCDEDINVGLSLGISSADLGTNLAFGDLNNDGQQDAVVVMYNNYVGGSLDLIKLAIMINVNGNPIHIYSEILGDRVNIESLKIEGGKIIVEFEPWMESLQKEIISLKLLED